MGVGCNLGLNHLGRKENSTGLDQQERDTNERPKLQTSCTTEEARTRPRGVDCRQGRDNQQRIVLGNQGQDQAPNNNISEEGKKDQDTREGYRDKRTTGLWSARQGTKEKAH